MRMCRYEKLNDEAISCRDIRELKEIIIPKIKRQYIAWKDKITEIIDQSGYTKKQFARLCHVSRGTLYKWCNGSIPNDRDKYIRVGLVAGYDIQQINELLQRYGHYSKLYPKRLEDSVCIFVLSQKYEKEVIEKYDYILEKIQKILCADEGKAEGDIPTDEFYKELTLLKGEEELEEFITSSVNVFSFAHQRLYAYIKSLLLNVQLGSMNYLAERQGWSSSLRQCISEIRQNKWYPNRKKLISLHFMMSVVCLLIYLSLENPDDYTEKRYGTFNYIAFVEIMKEYFNKNEKFQVLGLQMEGMQNIKDAMGVAYADIVLKEVAEYLMKAAGKDQVYYISENRFGILDQKKKEEWDKLIADIRERFDIPFYINKLQLSLSAGMAMIAYPNNAKQLEEAIDILSFSLNKAVDGNSKEVIYNQKECLAEARRESKLLQIMRDALKNNSFMVYYQPIYSVKEQSYTSAEALIRLIDPELGFISPDEFITLAERRGLILEIGEFVFRQVCLFIKENRIWEKGIHCIDVNLSAVQCMQEYLHQQLIGIMNEYEMDYRYIHLEVTETAAVNSGEALQNNMKQLMSYGVKFSLDDYGTGYSNLSNLIKFPFYTIKLDKSMVWSAMESEKAMCALKHTISMIKEMNNVIVAEGVETKEQALMLTEMGCDYFQGYYYSKPVNKEEFLKIVS